MRNNRCAFERFDVFFIVLCLSSTQGMSLSAPPSWQANPNAYPDTMTLHMEVTDTDGIYLLDASDELAAFYSDNSIAGVAQLTPKNELLGMPRDIWIMQVYGEDSKPLAFRYYDDSEGTVRDVDFEQDFVVNSQVGDAVNPRTVALTPLAPNVPPSVPPTHPPSPSPSVPPSASPCPPPLTPPSCPPSASPSPPPSPFSPPAPPSPSPSPLPRTPPSPKPATPPPTLPPPPVPGLPPSPPSPPSSPDSDSTSTALAAAVGSALATVLLLCALLLCVAQGYARLVAQSVSSALSTRRASVQPRTTTATTTAPLGGRPNPRVSAVEMERIRQRWARA